MNTRIKDFRLPRYAEIPAIGLYLDQTVKYLGEVFAPLGCVEVTPSMVSNYVKKGYIEKPVKKLYSKKQLAFLVFILLAKTTMSMENIDILMKSGIVRFTPALYDQLCGKLEKSLAEVFGIERVPDASGADSLITADAPGGGSASKADGADQAGRLISDDSIMDKLIAMISGYIYISSWCDYTGETLGIKVKKEKLSKEEKRTAKAEKKQQKQNQAR